MVKCTKGQIRRLKTALRWKGNPELRQRIQMVLLRESGMTQPAIAEAMGVSLSTVNRAHMAYDHGGLKALKSKPSGGRKRENMTLAEEKALLAGFAKAAGAGGMLNIHDLKGAYAKTIRDATRSSSMSYTENLPGRISSWFSTAPPTIAAATSRFPAISRCCSCRPIRRSSTRRKISGMKSARKSSSRRRGVGWN